jgi:hypothetical protein
MITTKIRNLIIAFGILASTGVATSSFAAGSCSKSEITFVGNSDNLPVFQLALNNSENSQYFITIRNSERKILLYEKLNGTRILRNYKLYTEDISKTEGTTFEIVNKKTKETVKYTVKGHQLIVENVSDFRNLMRGLATY